jgi:hypothetical protein
VRRAARTVATVLGGAVVAAVVLLVAVADLGSGAVLQLVGVLAAVAAAGFLALLARGRA